MYNTETAEQLNDQEIIIALEETSEYLENLELELIRRNTLTENKSARRMNQGHYVKDAFFFLQDLHGSLITHEVSDFSETDVEYARLLLSEIDDIRPSLEKLV
jgi:hypothetical protein